MRRMLRIASWMLLGSIAGGGAALADSDVHYFVGQKTGVDARVDTPAGELDADDLLEFGIGINLDMEWPVKITLDILHGENDDAASYTSGTRGAGGSYSYTYELELKTREIHAGVRYEFQADGRIRSYAGGGLAWAKMDAQLTRRGSAPPARGNGSSTLFDDGASGTGYFVNAGVLFELDRRLGVGLDMRYSNVDARLSDSSERGASSFSSSRLEVGGFHYGVTLGYRW